MKLHKILIIVG